MPSSHRYVLLSNLLIMLAVFYCGVSHMCETDLCDAVFYSVELGIWSCLQARDEHSLTHSPTY